MIYREFQPNPVLDPYIETYWTAYGFNEPEEYHRILPDGCVDIILSPAGFTAFCSVPIYEFTEKQIVYAVNGI